MTDEQIAEVWRSFCVLDYAAPYAIPVAFAHAILEAERVPTGNVERIE